MVWGTPVTEPALVDSGILGGSIFTWVSQETETQLKKFGQNLSDVCPDALTHAARFLSRSSDSNCHKHGSEANIAGLEVKAGIIEYFSRSDTSVDGDPWQETWQSYLGLRVTRPLPTIRNEPTLTCNIFNSKFWYKIKCAASPEKSLDVKNDGNQMRDGRLKVAKDGHYSGQLWQLRPSAGDPTTYKLRTMWLGSDRWLTGYSDDEAWPRLAPSSGSPEQDWYIDLQSNGSYMLRNVRHCNRMLMPDESGTGLEMRDIDCSQPGWILQRDGPVRAYESED